jgi:GAF domain-containing protein
MRIPLLFATLVCTAIPLFAQDTTQIKILRRNLGRASEAEKFELLNKLAWEYRAYQPDSAIDFGKKALEWGEKFRKTEIALSLNFIGLGYYHKGDHLVAYDYFKKAMDAASTNADELQLAHAYNNVGRLFMEQGLLDKGHAYLLQAKEIFERKNEWSGLAYCLQSLGNYYKLKEDYAASERSYLQAYQIRLRLDNPKELISAMLQLGKMYLAEHKIDEALTFFHRADSTSQRLGDGLLLAEARVNLAECEMTRGNLPLAEQMAEEGLSKIKSYNNGRLLPEAYLTMGQIQYKKGDIEKARKYFTLTLGVSAARKDLNTRLEAYFFLWQFSKRNTIANQTEMDLYTNYMTLRDSIRTLEAAQQESKLHFQLTIEQKEAENDILKAKEERKLAVIYSLIFMVFLVLIILYLVIKNRKRILRVTHLLEDRNNEIKKVNLELERKHDTLENHMATLVEFSKNRSIAIGNMTNAARHIVEVTARRLQVSQVSIWVYHDEEQCIETIAGFNLHKGSHLSTMRIAYQDAPVYFETLRKERMIVANQARELEATREFAESYFKPNDIYSLLDVSVFQDGELKGLLCCEQQHELRTWTAEDMIFATSVADVISLAFRTAQRLEYEMHIKDQNRKISLMNDVLEERVKQRTEELETQNKRLAEYAFINSHSLRGPLSRILGIINLIDHNKSVNEPELIEHLKTSGNDLDLIVKKIGEILHSGNYLTIDKLNEYINGKTETDTGQKT